MKNGFYDGLVASVDNGIAYFYLHTSAFEMNLVFTKDNVLYMDEEEMVIQIGSSEFKFIFDEMEIGEIEDEYGTTYTLTANENERLVFIV